MFTKEMINKYAENLLFELNNDEVNDLLDEFDVIKENMDIIASIDGIENVKPLSFVQDITTDTLRNDEENREISTYDALKNSGGTIEDVISLPKVVG